MVLKNKEQNNEDCPFCKVADEAVDNLDKRLTKKEKYLLKKQQKEETRFKAAKKKKIKKFLILFLPLVVLSSVIIYLVVFSGNQGTPRIEITPTEYNAGTVSMSDGLVEKIFEIKNVGQGNLKISDIKTSCMCTTAILEINEETSPQFDMHSSNLFWSEKLEPGEIGLLKVVFDPSFHGPQGTGSVVRTISIFSNDSENREMKARLLADVIP